MNRRTFVARGSLILASLGLSACAGYGPGHGEGPPAHAPAHGYRRKLRGADLVYDSGLGVYVVVGYPYYYLDDRFYRQAGDSWQVSIDLYGPWQAVSNRSLPLGLQVQVSGGKRGGPHGGPPGQTKKR